MSCTRSLVLCADDYALSEAVSQGIMNLVQQGRLSAVSCMVESPRWEIDARALQALSRQVDIGLHFNLTEEFGQGAYRLRSLIVAGLLGAAPKATVRARLAAQIDRFERVMGRLPDFIDGHQHVHALPGLVDAFMDVCEQRFTGRKPYIRQPLPDDAGGKPFKARVIRALVGQRLATRCRAAGFPTNGQFLGMYAFSGDAAYPQRMRAWLAGVNDTGALMMCHPALPGESGVDPIAASRVAEYRYLASPDFVADCESAGVCVVRFRNTNTA